MDEGDVHAKVLALLERRMVLQRRDWKRAVDSFRSGFFGPDHKRLSFPVKLHMIASCASLKDIFWLDDGTSFAINRDGYRRHIMFVFFDQHKLKSFQNIMSFYGFKTRLSLGRFPEEEAPNFIVYRHPSFVQGHQELSVMIRHPRKGFRGEGGAKKKPSVVPRSDEIVPKRTESSDRRTDQQDKAFDEVPSIFRSSSFNSASVVSYEGMEADANLLLADEWDVASDISLAPAEEKQLLRDLDIEHSSSSSSSDASPRCLEIDVDGCSFKSLSTSCDSDVMSF